MSNLKKTAFIVAIFSIITRGISFLFKIYISRSLGAEAMGLFSMSLSVIGLLVMLPSSGIPLTLSRDIASLNAKRESKRINSRISSGLVLGLTINITIIGIFLLFKNYFFKLLSDSRAETLIMIMLPSTLTTTVYNVLRTYFMGKKQYVKYSITELVEEILNVILVTSLSFGVFVSVQTNNILAIAYTLADFLCFVLITIMFFCNKGRLARPRELKPLIKSSTPITFMHLFTALSTTFTAIIIPNRLVASGVDIAEATAEYGRATGMAYPLLFAPLALTSSLSVVLLPELAELNALNDKKQISLKLDKGFIVAYMISTLFFITYFALGKPIGKILFDDELAGTFISFASGMVLPLSVGQISATSLNSLGKERIYFINNLIGLLLMLACMYFLPSIIGIYALAVAQTLFHIVTFLLNCIMLCKYKVSNVTYYKPMLYLSIISLIIAFLVNSAYKYLSNFNIPMLITVLICGIIILILYLLSILSIKRFRSELIDTVNHFFRRGTKKKGNVFHRR